MRSKRPPHRFRVLFLVGMACRCTSYSAFAQSVDVFEAKVLWSEHLAIELAGVVWIVAEVLILLLLIAATRHVSRETMPSAFRVSRSDKRRGAIILGCLGLVSVLVLSRHGLIVDPSDIARSSDGRTLIDSAAFATAHASSVSGHLFVWMVFVSVWVLLEIAIVSQGIRLYRRMRFVLTGAPLRMARFRWLIARWVIALGVALFAATLAHGQLSIEAAYVAAEADAAPLRSFVHLYLRVAGVVWIAVEWTAAVFLIMGYRLLRRRIDAEGAGP